MVTIKDLPEKKELDDKAMEKVKGGLNAAYIGEFAAKRKQVRIHPILTGEEENDSGSQTLDGNGIVFNDHSK